jgi:hypothetical protein
MPSDAWAAAARVRETPVVTSKACGLNLKRSRPAAHADDVPHSCMCERRRRSCRAHEDRQAHGDALGRISEALGHRSEYHRPTRQTVKQTR